MILAGILVMVLISAAIYRYIAPSNEKQDLELYVPADIAAKMDQRIYVDTKEGILSYATTAGVIQARTGEAVYVIGKETKQTEKPILVRTEKSYYIALSFIGEHASCYYKEYKDPSRLVVIPGSAPALARNIRGSQRCRRAAGLLWRLPQSRKMNICR